MAIGHKPYYVKAGCIWLASLLTSKARKFHFDGTDFAYFRHPYNFTWLNERQVEIPIMKADFERHQKDEVLEVGNVLAHYMDGLQHDVVDLYEKAHSENLFREDAETCRVGCTYDYIFSISTLEHVGWDESPRDEEKIGRTLDHLFSLLNPGGELIFSAPVGYSPPLDLWLETQVDRVEIKSMYRCSAANEWREEDWGQTRNRKFHHPFPFANGLVVVRMVKTSGENQ